MPRVPFQKPKKIDWEILSDRYGRLVTEPFEKGYALTVGSSMRRTLLSIVPGAAVTWVRIDGVERVEDAIPGVTESTTDVLLNFKKLAVQVPSGETKTVRLDLLGPRTVTGADVPETGGIEVLNPELHLFTLGPRQVALELGIGVGRGYVSADAHPPGTVPAGAIALDAAFSPILKVTYDVEMSRLGKITDYEKLVLEIWTNGSIAPDEALVRSAGYLKEHFALLAPDTPAEDEAEAVGGGDDFLRDALAKPIEELPLTARAVNALKNAEVTIVADLAQKTDADLEQVKNLGDKSIDEIKTALGGLGLSLGMRIDPAVLGSLNRGAAQ
jgi:DNA-directed RNA polymerase subunit alpha